MQMILTLRSSIVIVLLTALLWNRLDTSKLAAAATQNDTPYPRAGWSTQLSTLAHGVSGKVTIVDAQTIVLSEFNYDGGGPRVYAYLGITNTNAAFEAGLPIGPLLTRANPAYVSDTLTLTLPASQTLDGYTAIAIWCTDFKVNFGSGLFAAPALTPTLTLTPVIFLPLTLGPPSLN